MSNRSCQKKLLCCPNHMISSITDIKDLANKWHEIIPTSDALEAIGHLNAAQVLIDEAKNSLMKNITME